MDTNSVSVIKACLLLYFCYILSQRLTQLCSTFIFDSQNLALICVFSSGNIVWMHQADKQLVS